MWNNTEQELIEGVLRYGPDILDHCQSSDDLKLYFDRLDQERLDYPRPTNNIDTTEWFLPKEYQDLDIEKYCLDLCQNDDEYARVALELELFRKHNMTVILKCMKYLVDTLRKNNVVWGVGRGSSVASYVLHLIGVHKINSIKYNLPIEEFFKGETNG